MRRRYRVMREVELSLLPEYGEVALFLEGEEWEELPGDDVLRLRCRFDHSVVEGVKAVAFQRAVQDGLIEEVR